LSLAKAFVRTPIKDLLDLQTPGKGISVNKYDPTEALTASFYPAFFAFATITNPKLSDETVRDSYISEGAPFLRLTFSQWLVFTNRVTMRDISMSIADKGVFTVISPTHIGVVDIHVNPFNLTVQALMAKKGIIDLSDNDIRMLYLQMVVIPKITNEVNFVVSDASNNALSLSVKNESIPIQSTSLALFKAVLPLQRNTLELYMSDTLVEGGENLRKVWVNQYMETISGIPRSNLTELINIIVGKTGDTNSIVEETEEYLIVRMPPSLSAYLGKHADVLLNYLKEEINKDLNVYEEEVIRIRTVMREATQSRTSHTQIIKMIAENMKFPKRTMLMKNSKYTYLLCLNGMMPLKSVIIHPAVNPRFTISNNPHEIINVLGIEAARAWVYREFFDLITNTGKTLNPRHIQVIVDEMSTTGTLMPFTARGSARQHHGAFSEASFEQALQAFKRSAVSGEKESVKSTSASVLIGNRCAFGTGSFYIGTSTVLQKEPEAQPPTTESVIRTMATTADLGPTSITDNNDTVGIGIDAVAPILRSSSAEQAAQSYSSLPDQTELLNLPPLDNTLTAFVPLVPASCESVTDCTLSKIDIGMLQKRFSD
jgi:hypothetical protein